MFNRRQVTPNRGQSGSVFSRPAPVGGWNARDALANMPPTDAVSLVNWFPTPSLCMVRKGKTDFATGLPDVVETVAAYNGASSKLFAASDGKIYDVTSGGAVGAAVVSGLTSNRFQYINFTTAGGVRYLCMVNGADSPRFYNGSAWITITGASTPAITGITTSNIASITSHKGRLWLIMNSGLDAYYLPTGDAGGAATVYPMASVFKGGGKILAAETWSADAGSGIADHLVFVTDQGEVAIFAGSDPSDADAWALVGLYWIGAAIGRRPLLKYGGDVLIICQYGLLPMSQLLQSVVINTASTLTDKIQFATSTSISAYGNFFGWQMIQFAKENQLLLNVPISETEFEQYVMNTISGAWCRFTGWNAFCWEVWGDHTYFGGDGVVSKAWDGYDDAGEQINTDLKTAFDYFGMPGVLKQWTMCRPIISSDSSPAITYGLNVDFSDDNVAGVPSFISSPTGIWDSATWDVSAWGGGLSIFKGWQFLSGLGYCGALRMKTASRGATLQLSSIDYMLERGGVL